MKKTVDIIIPAYNEEGRIGATLDWYRTYFSEWVQTHAAEMTLTVVVNGTTDRTADVVQQHASQDSTIAIRSIVIPEKIGKGGAVYAGWKNATAEIVGFVDADASTSASEYAKLLEYLLNNEATQVRGVIASRFIGGAHVLHRTSPLRTLMSHTFITIIQWLFWLPYKDTQCGAKIFHREVITEVLPALRENGMQFDVELLWRLHRAGHRIVELPTIWEDMPGSAKLNSKWDFIVVGASMVWKLILLRIRG